jgi:hypothetical protein
MRIGISAAHGWSRAMWVDRPRQIRTPDSRISPVHWFDEMFGPDSEEIIEIAVLALRRGQNAVGGALTKCRPTFAIPRDSARGIR